MKEKKTIASTITTMLERIDPHQMDRAIDVIVHILSTNCSKAQRTTILEHLATQTAGTTPPKTIEVSHAHTLSQQSKTIIETGIAQWLNEPCIVHYKHSPALLGGIRIEWEGALIRASVADKLQALQETLNK